MAAESLRDELMALPGVADAEVDESGDSPSGIRVRLEPDADARAVGAEVQRVLADHGMRSRITSGAETEPQRRPPPLVPPPPGEPPPTPAAGSETEAAVPEPRPGTRAEEPGEGEGPTPAAATPVEGLLASVTMTESRDGVDVAATAADGRTATRRSAATREAMMEAVVAVVGELAEGAVPGIVKLEVGDAEGSQVVLIVVERGDGSRAAGASLVRIGYAFAVGRATWAALTDH